VPTINEVKNAIRGTTSSVANMIPTTNDLRNLCGNLVETIRARPITALLSAVTVGFLAGSLLRRNNSL
jgi:hypothetical protein